MRKTAAKKSEASEPFELRNWHAVAILSALSFVFFKDILLGNAFLWEDFLYYNYPVRHFAATSLAQGDFPLWNPYTFNGMPFFADIQTAVLYLPCLALTLFVQDGSLNHYWLQLVIVLHYILAGVTMYYLAMSFGLRRLPALFGGVAYMLSSFMILHAIHQQIITMVAWFPLIFLLCRHIISTVNWMWVFLTALVLAHAMLAGFPQLTLYLYFFLATYILYELITLYPGRKLLSPAALMVMLRLAAALGLSMALMAVQLLPTLELAELSQRAAITYEKATEGQMSWGSLLTLIFPKFFGVADASGYNYWGTGIYWYYWETCIYRGGIPLLLTVLSLLLWKSHKIIPFLWGFSVFALLFGLGDNLPIHKIFYDFIPGFSSFRSPARMLAFMGLAVGVLSAFSLNHILYVRDPGHARWRNMIFAVCGGALLFWLLFQTGTLAGMFPFLAKADIRSAVSKELNISMFFLVLSGALLVGLLHRKIPMRLVVLLLVGLTSLDLFVFGGSQNNAQTNPSQYFHQSDDLIRSMRQNSGGEIFRVNSRNERGMIMDRNQGMVSRLFMMEGYTPLALQRVYPPVTSADLKFDLLNVKYRTVVNNEQTSLMLVPRASTIPRAIIVHNFSVATDETHLESLLNEPGYDPRTMALLEVDPGRALTPREGPPVWTAKVREHHPNRILVDVDTDREGILVLSEMFYPGWKAYVQGSEKPIFRTNYNLRGIFVDAGSYTVEVRFTPDTLRAGAGISITSLLLCALGLTVSFMKRRGATAPSA